MPVNRHKWVVLMLLTLGGCSHATPALEAPISRQQQVDRYLQEFASAGFKHYYTNIYQALQNALNKLPDDVFEQVTDRRSPLIFVNSISSGIARYAHATEFRIEPNDPPTFTDGFYLITLGDEMNLIKEIEAIEGVILHEIAHDYLQHLRAPKHNCEMEREANRLVKAWGYSAEYAKASDVFGAKKKGDSPCADYFRAQEEKLKQ